MRTSAAMTFALVLPAVQACSCAQAPQPAPWLLAFDGKSTNELVRDKRFAPFLHRHVTTRRINYWGDKPGVPANDAVEFLHGPPDDVNVTEHRYVTASACVAHDAMDCGLLWADTRTGATIFAASIFRVPPPIATNSARLWLFSNMPLTSAALPPNFTAAIAQWSAHSNGDGSHTRITDVTLVQPDGKQSKLHPTDVHAWTPTSTAGK